MKSSALSMRAPFFIAVTALSCRRAPSPSLDSPPSYQSAAAIRSSYTLIDLRDVPDRERDLRRRARPACDPYPRAPAACQNLYILDAPFRDDQIDRLSRAPGHVFAQQAPQAIDPRLWHLEASGQYIGPDPTCADVDIDEPAAREVAESPGAPQMFIGLIDGRVAWQHPWILGRIQNPLPQSDGGRNASLGLDLVDGDDDPDGPTPRYPLPTNIGHGTAMASLIVGRGQTEFQDRRYAFRGVAPGHHVIPVRVLDDRGYAPEERLFCGICYLIDLSSRMRSSGGRWRMPVINLSIGSSGEMRFVSRLLDEAQREHDVVFTLAAGNLETSGCHSDGAPLFPTTTERSKLLRVGGVDVTGAYHDMTCSNQRVVDLAAPSASLLAAGHPHRRADGTFDAHYAPTSGSSAATAIVAGVVSRLAAVHPELTGAELVRRIRETAVRSDWLVPCVETGGRVNLFRALTGRVDLTHQQSDGTYCRPVRRHRCRE